MQRPPHWNPSLKSASSPIVPKAGSDHTLDQKYVEKETFFVPVNLQMTTRMNNDCAAQVYTHVVVVLLLNTLFLLLCLGLHLFQLQTVEKVISSETIINIIMMNNQAKKMHVNMTCPPPRKQVVTLFHLVVQEGQAFLFFGCHLGIHCPSNQPATSRFQKRASPLTLIQPAR